MPAWLNDAVFYEIYPQSFYDSNGDGIGDINGITAKLDYIRSLGCNALWINPCFDSPFKDAGYDVRDYKKVAPRYGTNQDLAHLFAEAHARGIHVLLDLVPCHTSEEHPWFLASAKAERNEYTDRFIWTDNPFASADGLAFVGGEHPRAATYVPSFFKCQPALNFGFLHPTLPWQLPMDHPACLATREAIKDVMRFWLDMGCDGFRVDMAACPVKKDDDEHTGTSAVWRDVRAMLDRDYPDAAMVSEWGVPGQSLKAGFHMDFYLDHPDNGYHALMRAYGKPEDHAGPDPSYFNRAQGGDATHFARDYVAKYEGSREYGLFCFLTCNHDTVRPRGNLTPDELKLAYTLVFTMPGAPFLYYGDEIGMRYLDIPTKEGGFYRTGSRTPMQWDNSANLGFSSAAADQLYLPVDSAPDAPTVAAQQDDPDSLLNTVRALLALRHAQDDLKAEAPFQLVAAPAGSRLLAYRRGALTVAFNPGDEELALEVPGAAQVLFAVNGATVERGTLHLPGGSCAVVR